MSVLPMDRYGSYYIIFHQDVSNDCIDADTVSLTNNDNNRKRRDDYGFEQTDVTSEQVRTAPKTNCKFAGTSLPANCMQVHDDEDEYDYYDDGCASHITEVFVASSIPVLHFIQYFMC